MPRHILSLSSQVAYGPVGNSAAVPALQAAGFTVLQIPTILLSNHPGLGKPAGKSLPASDMQIMVAALENLGALKKCTGVMTGYFATAQQVHVAAACIKKMRNDNPALFVLVDPVLGDGDRLYVAEDVARAIRNELLPLATCITPNSFELSWLTEQTIANRKDTLQAASLLHISEILATSVPMDNSHIANLVVSGEVVAETLSVLQPAAPHGTGDFLAGLYLASRLNGLAPQHALTRSVSILECAIARSAGEPCLDIIGALHEYQP